MLAERKRNRDFRKRQGFVLDKKYYRRNVLKQSIIHYNAIVR